jgi:histidinol-phosphatase
MAELDLDRALEAAQAAVDAAMAASMKHFRTGVAVERKPDRSPVTRADQDSERAILEVLKSAFPSHSILAEESGAHAGDPAHRWIVDPLDGTRGFARGSVFWGPLVALEKDGEIVVGAMALPAAGIRYWAAKGKGAYRDGTRLRVSGVPRLEDATLSLGQLSGLLAGPQGAGVQKLIGTVDSARAYGDLAACAMLLDGRADIWLETGVQPWDLAPTKILVEEAGGQFTDFLGKPTVHSGNAVATNGALQTATLTMLRGAAQ